jgi:NAD(P)-dependent dehydrogenase (short-subunit alcohol dehydrogenase family)
MAAEGRLSGKVAIVTGAAKGQGEGVARVFAAEGATVAVLDVLDTLGREAVERISDAGGRARYFHCDVSQESEVAATVETVAGTFAGLDILYNNAAIMHPWREQIQEHTLPDWQSSFQVNVFALVRLCARLVPAMRKRGWGRVVNVTSGIDKTPQLAGYGASKWAVDKFTDDLAAEFKDTGVIVSRLDPGWLRTDLGGQQAPNDPATVLPGALVPVLLPDDAPSGQFFRAQDLHGAGN